MSLVDFAKTIQYLGEDYHIRVSPFCWKNKWSYMQISICAGNQPATNRASHFIEWKAWFDETTELEVMNHAYEYLMYQDGAAILDQLAKEHRQQAEAYEKQLAEANELRKQQQLVEDASFKAKGFTHKVVAWIHADEDYPVILFSKGEPSKKSIQSQIRKRGSSVLDDYHVHTL